MTTPGRISRVTAFRTLTDIRNERNAKFGIFGVGRKTPSTTEPTLERAEARAASMTALNPGKTFEVKAL